MTTIYKAELVFPKDTKHIEYMRILTKKSVYGNNEIMQASKRAFDNMTENEELVMTWKYPDYLPPLMGTPMAWRVQKVQD